MAVQIQSQLFERSDLFSWTLSSIFRIILTLIFCLSTTYGEGTQIGPCTYQYSNGDIVDLSSLGFDNNTARWSGLEVSAESSKYSYNPCHPFSIQDTPCQDVAACREATDGSGEVYAIGDANSATFEEDEDFLYIVYKSKTADVERSTRVQLTCDDDISPDPQLMVLEEFSPTIYQMDLLSKFCCKNLCAAAQTTMGATVTAATHGSPGTLPPTDTPVSVQTSGTLPPSDTPISVKTAGTVAPKSPKKLSAGSVLCILFVCLVAAYIIFGAIYMKLFVGASGKEIFPNVAFWEDFPTLVMDGFMLVFSPCTGGASKTTSKYEDL